MRPPLLLSAALLSFTAHAQTYFYVDNIVVAPQAPNSTDNITVALHGGLSSTGAYVVNASATVVGNSVTLTVNSADPGGFTVIVPHTETIQVGQLPPGNYTIAINGTGTGDFAPQPEHLFTVQGGGSPCDSLIIGELQFAAFNDSTVELTVSNYSSVLFDYPGFILRDDNGDTLAIETVNYFGIGTGPQLHLLSIVQGATLPIGNFVGTLELWTGFYTAQACSFPIDQDLCPPGPCSDLYVSIANTGGAMVNSTFDWYVLDSLGTSVGTGQMVLGPGQMDTAMLCLPPGSYVLHMSQPAPSGGQLTMGATDLPYGQASISGNFVQGGPNQLAVPFYPLCVDGTNSIAPDRKEGGLSLVVNEGRLLITGNKGLGELLLYDMQGRTVVHHRTTASTADINISALAPGCYLLSAPTTGQAAQRFVKP